MTFLSSAKAKAGMAQVLGKGQTKAKTATVPAKQVKASHKTSKVAEAANAKWERPNLNALCRKLVAQDMAAGLLLFHIIYVWKNRKHKITRGTTQWLAHSRDAWAQAAGLSSAEMKDRALPRVRKYCWEFLTIKAMGHGSDKKLYVHLDEIAFAEAVAKSEPWDMYQAALNGIGIGVEKPPANAYAKGLK
jgi:hypothetical protein